MHRGFRKSISFLKEHRKKALVAILLSLTLCTATILLALLLPKPNDNIYSGSSYLFENKNPAFNVGFGSKENLNKQYIRFESRSSSKNPFEETDRSIWREIGNIFTNVDRKGFEMSLSRVNVSDVSFSDSITNNFKDVEIETETEVVKVGHIIGEDEVEGVSKQTVVNRDVYPGIDLEYQIFEGYGLKEDIVIKDLDAYRNRCSEDEYDCILPPNEFIFNLRLDEGVELKKSISVDKKYGASIYYLTDQNGNYLAHFLPTFAKDALGTKTNSVDMDVEKVSDRNYQFRVILDSEWLFSEGRKLPIRIDPSVVHDTELELSTGTLDRVEIADGGILRLTEKSYSGEYISGVVDFEAPSTFEIIDFLSKGIETGDGETAYSTTGLIIDLGFNESVEDKIVNNGECQSECNATMINFSNNLYSGITTEHRKWGQGALFCDGLDDYAYILNNPTLESVQNISFEVWYKPSGEYSETEVILGNPSYGFGTYNNEFGFWLNSPQNIAKTELPTIGEWSYWVGTYDGTAIKLYKDAVLVNSFEYSGDITVSNLPIRICSGTQDGANYSYSRGVVDTFRVYSRVLEESEIMSNYNGTDIQIDYRTGLDGVNWSEWSNPGEELEVDLSGFLSNSTPENLIYSSPLVDTPTVYNGIDENRELQKFDYYSNGIEEEFTISAYINLTEIKESYVLGDSDPQGGMAIEISQEGTIRIAYAGEYYDFSYNIEVDKGYYITVSSNEEQLSLYINGTFVEGIPLLNDFLASESNFFVASSPSGDKYSSGVIDEISIYSVEKDAEEIFYTYNQLYRKLQEYYPEGQYVKNIGSLDLSAYDKLSVSYATDISEEALTLSYGPTLYSVNEYDQNTLGIWSFLDSNLEESIQIDNITSEVINTLSENQWTVDLLITPTQELLEDSTILGFGDTLFTFRIFDSGLEVVIGGVENQILSNMMVGTSYYISLTWDGQIAKLYLNGVYIKDLDSGSIDTDSGILTVNPSSIDIRLLRVSDVVRSNTDIRRVYENISGKRGAVLKTIFKADLVEIDTVTDLQDFQFTIDERPYGTQKSIENILVGDTIILKERVEELEYIAKGIVENTDSESGQVLVEDWQEGGSIPSEGFTSNAAVFKYQTEYISLLHTLNEDRVDVKYLTINSKIYSQNSTIYINNISGIKNSSTLEFNPIPNVRYVQYKATISRNNLLLSPSLSQIELIHNMVGPTMDQIMRHGKWFDNTGQQQPYWWVKE